MNTSARAEDSKKISNLFNFMAGKGGQGKGGSKGSHLSIPPDVLSTRGTHPSNMGQNDVPYGRVLDEVREEENIYAEITDGFGGLKLGHNHHALLNFQLPNHQAGSNMSSLLKGGGGSDGAFSGTLSGTFSSSNPSSREEDIYDNVF